MEHQETNADEKSQVGSVFFTRGVLSFLGLTPKNIMLMCGPYRVISVLQNASFEQISFITPKSGLLDDALEKYQNKVAMRFVFANPEEKPIQVPGILTEKLPYSLNEKYQLCQIQLDIPLEEKYQTMIESILTIKNLPASRGEPRLVLYKNDADDIGLDLNECFVKIDSDINIKRCYLCDLSFSCAGIILMGPKLLEENQPMQLLLHLQNHYSLVELTAQVKKSSWHNKDLQLIKIVLSFSLQEIPNYYRTFLHQALCLRNNQHRGALC